jgi:hypothetical protein
MDLSLKAYKLQAASNTPNADLTCWKQEHPPLPPGNDQRNEILEVEAVAEGSGEYVHIYIFFVTQRGKNNIILNLTIYWYYGQDARIFFKQHQINNDSKDNRTGDAAGPTLGVDCNCCQGSGREGPSSPQAMARGEKSWGQKRPWRAMVNTYILT